MDEDGNDRRQLRLRHPNHKYGIASATAPIASFRLSHQEGWQRSIPQRGAGRESLFVLLKASLQARLRRRSP